MDLIQVFVFAPSFFAAASAFFSAACFLRSPFWVTCSNFGCLDKITILLAFSEDVVTFRHSNMAALIRSQFSWVNLAFWEGFVQISTSLSPHTTTSFSWSSWIFVLSLYRPNKACASSVDGMPVKERKAKNILESNRAKRAWYQKVHNLLGFYIFHVLLSCNE